MPPGLSASICCRAPFDLIPQFSLKIANSFAYYGSLVLDSV